MKLKWNPKGRNHSRSNIHQAKTKPERTCTTQHNPIQHQTTNAAQDGALHVHTDVSPVLAQVFTDKFDVYSAKRFPGVPGESLSFFESRPFLLVFVLLGPAYFGWCL